MPIKTKNNYTYSFVKHGLSRKIFIEKKNVLNEVQGKIHTLYFKAPISSKNKKLIIFFDNQGSNNEFYQYFYHFFPHNFCYDMITFDYSGYGKSTGTAKKSHLLYDALVVYIYAIKNLKIKPENIVFYGQSLGTGVATAFAAALETKVFQEKERVKDDTKKELKKYKKMYAALILDSPFANLKKAIEQKYKWAHKCKLTNLLIDLDFLTEEFIGGIKTPILLMHGENDKMFPTSDSEILFNNSSNSTFCLFKNRGHNLLNQDNRAPLKKIIHHFFQKKVGFSDHV